MKRFLSCLLAISVIAGFIIPAYADTTPWKEYYVSVNGSDSNPGTKEAPFKTVQKAKDAVRAVNQDMQGDIVVNIESGTYYLGEELDFRNEDSAYNGHRIIYRGTGSEKPVLSGGNVVTGFTQSEYENIWVADYDSNGEGVLQLTVDGKKRYPAKNSHFVVGQRMSDEYLASEYAIEGMPLDYNDPDRPWLYDGLRLLKRDFMPYENLEDVLFQWEMGFLTYVLHVDEVKQDPDSDEHWLVNMEPEWNSFGPHNDVKHPSPEFGCTISNAFELLDEPGEFYYNRKTKKLYYMPAEGETLSTSTVIVPELETLVRFDGNDVDDKIKNITFQNIHFRDTKLDYFAGLRTHQAVLNFGSGMTNKSTSAILGLRTDGIKILNNIFSCMGGNAVAMTNACENFDVIGNAMYDIGDNGIIVGDAHHGDWTFGSAATGRPSTPEREAALIKDGKSDDVPEEYKDAAVNLIADDETRLWYSLYSSGSTNERNVVSYRYNENDVIISNPQAVNHPGYPCAERHYDGEGGYFSTRNHVTWMEDLDELKSKTNSMGRTKAKYDSQPGLLYNGVWRDTLSKDKGVKPYVIAEFVRPYKLDEITVTFDPMYVNAGVENADYEVLVSNDKSFKEGSYKVIHTQNGVAPSDVNTYKVNDDTKYKYVMVRKLYAGDLGLSRMFVTTFDRKPFVKTQYCDNFRIENNLVKRTGLEMGRACGITVLAGRNGTVLHNEVADTSYTAISVGFSWQNTKITTYNMDVGYNYCHDNAKVQLDGGTIYFLGWQPGMKIHHNYLVNPKLSRCPIYCDSGSRGYTIYNNFFESTHTAENLRDMGNPDNEGAIIENSSKYNFATFQKTWVLRPDLTDWVKHTQEVMGQPTREAWDVYTNAGLEDEYKHLQDLVPVGGDNFYPHWDYNHVEGTTHRSGEMLNATYLETLKYLLENGKFGDGLGLYPAEAKAMAEGLVDYLNNTADYEARAFVAPYAIEAIRDMLPRYSLEETLALCEETLAYAKGEGAVNYPADAVVAFEKSLAEIKKMQVTTPETEYDKLIALENAYNALLNKKYSDKIIRLEMPDILGYDINEETSTATVYVKRGTSFKTSKLNITTEGGSSISRILSGTQDLDAGIKVPVYHAGTNKYRLWTVKASYEEPVINTNITKDTGWTTMNFEKWYNKPGTEFISFAGSQYPTMSTVHGEDKETSLTFAPYTNNTNKEFTLILGAKKPEAFDSTFSNSADFNRCEVVFKGNDVSFYKVISGSKTQIGTTNTSNIKWNQKNNLTYQITEVNTNAHFLIKLNGEIIFSDVVLPKDDCGRYLGFYNPYINIRVY